MPASVKRRRPRSLQPVSPATSSDRPPATRPTGQLQAHASPNLLVNGSDKQRSSNQGLASGRCGRSCETRSRSSSRPSGPASQIPVQLLGAVGVAELLLDQLDDLGLLGLRNDPVGQRQPPRRAVEARARRGSPSVDAPPNAIPASAPPEATDLVRRLAGLSLFGLPHFRTCPRNRHRRDTSRRLRTRHRQEGRATSFGTSPARSFPTPHRRGCGEERATPPSSPAPRPTAPGSRRHPGHSPGSVRGVPATRSRRGTQPRTGSARAARPPCV